LGTGGTTYMDHRSEEELTAGGTEAPAWRSSNEFRKKSESEGTLVPRCTSWHAAL
jgi:hypothetical protein